MNLFGFCGGGHELEQVPSVGEYDRMHGYDLAHSCCANSVNAVECKKQKDEFWNGEVRNRFNL
jgi:hypothetical protein